MPRESLTAAVQRLARLGVMLWVVAALAHLDGIPQWGGMVLIVVVAFGWSRSVDR